MYKFNSTNHEGYAVVEAWDSERELSFTLRVPMTKLYQAEASYILDTDDWDSAEDDGYYGKEFTMVEFLEGDTPKLISWWVQFLSPNKTRINIRRKIWTRQLTNQLAKIIAGLYSIFRVK